MWCLFSLFVVDQTGDISQALQKLTEPKVAKMYHIPSLSNVVHSASSRLAIKPGQAPINGDTLTTLLEVSYLSTKFVWMVGSLYFCFYWTCTPCSSQVMVQVKNFLAKIYIVEIRSVISYFILWCCFCSFCFLMQNQYQRKLTKMKVKQKVTNRAPNTLLSLR